jgi:MFS family permease
MSAPEMLPHGEPYDPLRARRTLIVLALMALMVTYVETMVIPAFSQFYTFFDQTGGSFSNVAWILSAYLLVGVVVTPVFGKLGDLYGKKRMLLVAMSIYAIAVTLAGFSPNIGAAFGVSRPNQIYGLIAVRAVQGIGMGMFPLAFAMIPEVFPPSKVGQSQGVLSGMFAAGACLGLVGGGYLAQTYGWQDTYHTVIPLAILVVILAYVLLKESPLHPDRRVDVPGVASLGAALTFLMLGITEGATWGWGNLSAVTFFGIPWGVPEFLLLAAVVFVFFGWWETKAPSPVIQFAAFKRRNILVSNVNAVFAGMSMFFVFTAFTILVEYPIGPGFNQSELTMGLLALPAAVSMLITGPIYGRLIPRLGPKPIMIFGFLMQALGALLLLVLNRSLLELTILVIPLLSGNVAVLIAMTNMIVLSADRFELGIQTGMNQTLRNLGSALAPVVTSTILASFVATFYVATTVVGPHGPVSVTVPVSGYSLTGFEVVFAVTGAIALVGALMSLFLQNYRFGVDGVRVGNTDTQRSREAAAAATAVTPASSSEIADPRPG